MFVDGRTKELEIVEEAQHTFVSDVGLGTKHKRQELVARCLQGVCKCLQGAFKVSEAFIVVN